MEQIWKDMLAMYTGNPLDLFLIESELSHAYEALGTGATGAGGRTKEASSNGIGSGRYRRGTGEQPYQHGFNDFLERVDYYKRSGVTNQKDLAVLCGCKNTTDFRVAYTKALHDWKQNRAAVAQEMLNSGKYKTKKAVAEALGIRDTTLTSWLNPKSLDRVSKAQTVADFLEQQVKEKKMIDVGAGVEKELNISSTKLTEALSILEQKGYQIVGGRVPQATNPGKKTTLKVLADTDQEWKDVYQHPELIQSVADYIVRDDGNGNDVVQKKWQYPASLDSSRLLIRYRDDVGYDGHTGIERDGTIEIRRNVPDLDLKGSHYAQVRILVDDDKYLKGMATYSDHIPDGYDVVFNTNKTRDMEVLKDAKKNLKKNPDDPFGALLRNEGGQYTYIDENGETKLGLINKTRQEGDWEDWRDSLPSQFLAKQPIQLIDKQLNKSIAERKAELDEIMALTNPTVKKELLADFAESCDEQAIHMNAAALPRQKYQVILPVPTLKDDEVYAPNFKNGETVACIRFPNQGLFEIVIAKVNNNNAQAKELIGDNAMDAVGLNKVNADRLSGADYDGDTVLCVPCNDPKYSDTKIMNQPLLDGLKDFDPKDIYKYDHKETRTEKVLKKDRFGNKVLDSDGNPVYEEQEVEHYYRNGKEFKPMTRTQMEMGIVSNLMMDATLKGATDEDKAAIARHCQVIIDAEKHHLDWQQSAIDNHIKELKAKYQGRIDEDGSYHEGASTLITRAKSPIQVVKPTGAPHIDPETGKLYYTDKQMEPQTYKDKKTGQIKTRMEDVDLLSTKDSAYDLVSDTRNPKEMAYARFSDSLRAMANEARKAIASTGDIEFNKQAEAQYHEEAEHLQKELMKAELNAPRERMAQLYARGITLARMRDNPDMTKKEQKKLSQKALVDGRIKFNAHRHKINISPREWEAIQAGAINKTKLKGILKYADSEQVRKYATPRATAKLTPGQITRIKSALDSGVSAAVLAEQYNVSATTINSYRKQKSA